MHNPRYVVVNEDAGWRIVQGGRRYPGSFSSKTLAIVTAIGFAEGDGHAGHRPEVLVRHEDGRFATEWVFGQDRRANRSVRLEMSPHTG
jgi:hypothetical protein